jgi:hypothetical protein
VTRKRRETLIALGVGIPIALAIAIFVPAVGWPRYRAARLIDELIGTSRIGMDSSLDRNIDRHYALKDMREMAASHPAQLVRYLDDDRRLGTTETISGSVARVLLDVHGDVELTPVDIDAVELDYLMGTAGVTSHTDAHAHFLSFCERWHAYASGDGPRPGVH